MNRFLVQILKPAVERLPSLARFYRYMRDTRLLYKEPTSTPLGFKMSGNKLMQDGLFEPSETAIAKKILSRVEIFINIGANIGYYACLARSINKPVVAFEPIALNVSYLLRNFKANGWMDGLEVFPIAIGNRVGVTEIYGGGTGASIIEGWAGISKDDMALVPISTLDIVLAERFRAKHCFILIDVEGAEKNVLEGATILLNMKPRPIWLIEITVKEHQVGKNTVNPNLLSTFDILFQHGYEAWTADSECRAVTLDEIKNIVDSKIDTLGVHNFLFMEQGQLHNYISY